MAEDTFIGMLNNAWINPWTDGSIRIHFDIRDDQKNEKIKLEFPCEYSTVLCFDYMDVFTLMANEAKDGLLVDKDKRIAEMKLFAEKIKEITDKL